MSGPVVVPNDRVVTLKGSAGPPRSVMKQGVAVTGIILVCCTVILVGLASTGSPVSTATPRAPAAAAPMETAAAIVPSPPPSSTVISRSVPDHDRPCLVRHPGGWTETCAQANARVMRQKHWHVVRNASFAEADADVPEDAGAAATDADIADVTAAEAAASASPVSAAELASITHQLLLDGEWPTTETASETAMLMSIADHATAANGVADAQALRERLLVLLQASGQTDLAAQLETRLRESALRSH